MKQKMLLALDILQGYKTYIGLVMILVSGAGLQITTGSIEQVILSVISALGFAIAVYGRYMKGYRDEQEFSVLRGYLQE